MFFTALKLKHSISKPADIQWQRGTPRGLKPVISLPLLDLTPRDVGVQSPAFFFFYLPPLHLMASLPHTARRTG